MKDMKMLNVDEAIKFIQNAIEERQKHVILNTKFGKLFVSTNCKNFDPGVNIIIEDWNITGPKNPCFNISGITNDVDYYVCICNPSSELRLHLLCIEAVYRIVFKSLFKIDISNDVVDALLIIHSYEKDKVTLTNSELSIDFINNNLGRFVRKDDMVQWLVMYHFESRLNLGIKVIDESEELFKNECKFSVCKEIKNNTYDRKIFGILLYVTKQLGIEIKNNENVLSIFNKEEN